MQILFEVISSFLQILVFSLVPFIFFLFRKDKTISFFRYIGFYRPGTKANAYAIVASLLFVVAALVLVLTDDRIRESFSAPQTVIGKLRTMGLSVNSVLTLFIIAWLRTSLSEEILFRGFIGKRLMDVLGFEKGNLFQALIFGIVHLLLFWLITDSAFFALMFILIFSTFAGWVVGYIKEKLPGEVLFQAGSPTAWATVSLTLL
jgi:uncharacterized protein